MEIIKIIEKIDYGIEENTPLCLLGKEFFGFLKKNQKKIVICTENAKRFSGYYIKRPYKNDDFNKTSTYIRRALRHESVHIAQACNNGNLIEINKNIKMHSHKTKAWVNSSKLSGEKEKEYQAYALEDKPRLVLKALKKYCL